MYKKESNIQNNIRLVLSEHGIPAFRNNIGAFTSEDGRFIEYGVGGAGGSDLICAVPVTITQDMVGCKIAVFGAFEVKTEKGKATHKQLTFIRNIKSFGGIGGIVRSPDDALKLITSFVPEKTK